MSTVPHPQVSTALPSKLVLPPADCFCGERANKSGFCPAHEKHFGDAAWSQVGTGEAPHRRHSARSRAAADAVEHIIVGEPGPASSTSEDHDDFDPHCSPENDGQADGLDGPATRQPASAAPEAPSVGDLFAAGTRPMVAVAVLRLVESTPGVTTEEAMEILARKIQTSSPNPAEIVRKTITRYVDTGRLLRDARGGLTIGRPAQSTPARPPSNAKPAYQVIDGRLVDLARAEPGLSGAAIRDRLQDEITTKSSNPRSIIGTRLSGLVGRGVLRRDDAGGYHATALAPSAAAGDPAAPEQPSACTSCGADGDVSGANDECFDCAVPGAHPPGVEAVVRRVIAPDCTIRLEGRRYRLPFHPFGAYVHNNVEVRYTPDEPIESFGVLLGAAVYRISAVRVAPEAAVDHLSPPAVVEMAPAAERAAASPARPSPGVAVRHDVQAANGRVLGYQLEDGTYRVAMDVRTDSPFRFLDLLGAASRALGGK